MTELSRLNIRWGRRLHTRVSHSRRPAVAAGVVAGLALSGLASAGELELTPSVQVEETYTTNIDLAPDNSRKSALVTRVTPGVSVRSESRRVKSALDALVIVRHQTAGDDKGFKTDLDIAGFTTLEIVDDIFLVDAQTSVTEQVLDSSAAGSTSNRKRVQVYRLSPYFRTRLGKFAKVEARYNFSQVLVESNATDGAAATSDQRTNGASVAVSSGRRFSRLRWTLTGRASESKRPDADDISRRKVELGGEYAILRSVSLLAGGGYQKFDDGVAVNKFSGAIWRGGLRLRPGPRTELQASYGRFNDSTTQTVKFSYDIGPKTRLTAGYVETLRTAQERLDVNTTVIGLDSETQNFIDQPSGDPFDPNASPFDIDNETKRTRSLKLGVRGTRGLNKFSVQAAFDNEEVEETGVEQKIVRLSGTWVRQLNPRWNVNLLATYERTDFDDGQLDNEFTSNAVISYLIFADIRATASFGFHKQTSNIATSRFTEHSGRIGLRAEF